MPDEMTVEQRINLLEEAHEVIDELHEYEQENDLRQNLIPELLWLHWQLKSHSGALFKLFMFPLKLTPHFC